MLDFKLGMGEIDVVVEAVERSSASRTGFVDIFGLFDAMCLGHALAEVAFVEGFAEYGLIERLELR